MGGRRVRIMVGVMVAVLVVGAGTAMGAKIFFKASNGQRSLGFTLNTTKSKIVGVAWEKLKCGESGRVTGGLRDAVPVNGDRSFKSVQSVTTIEGIHIDVVFKGTVSRGLDEVNGKMKFTGDCEQKATFTAAAQGG
jgi:hypothetical protein